MLVWYEQLDNVANAANWYIVILLLGLEGAINYNIAIHLIKMDCVYR